MILDVKILESRHHATMHSPWVLPNVIFYWSAERLDVSRYISFQFLLTIDSDAKTFLCNLMRLASGTSRHNLIMSSQDTKSSFLSIGNLFASVFNPTPRMPEILSELSPTKHLAVAKLIG